MGDEAMCFVSAVELSSTALGKQLSSASCARVPLGDEAMCFGSAVELSPTALGQQLSSAQLLWVSS